MATAETKVALCSKCGKNPKAGDEKDANPWCKECRAEYQREYKQRENWRAERRGIIRGIQAMREATAAYFAQWNGRPFMGGEVSAVVMQLPGPAVADEDAKKPTE
jgi:hypothetical protein